MKGTPVLPVLLLAASLGGWWTTRSPADVSCDPAPRVTADAPDGYVPPPRLGGASCAVRSTGAPHPPPGWNDLRTEVPIPIHPPPATADARVRIEVAGRVVDAEGRPVGFARVMAYRLERVRASGDPPDGIAREYPLAEGATNGDGAWHMRVPRVERAIFVAFADDEVWVGDAFATAAPGATAVDVAAVDPARPVRIELRAIAPLEGTLLVNRRARADRPFAVIADAVVPEGAIFLENPLGIGFLWTGEEVVPRCDVALVAEDGSFRFDALPPGTWDVAPFGGGRRDVDRTFRARALARVDAPASGVRLDVAAVELEVEVCASEDHRPIGGAKIVLEAGGSPAYARSKTDGRATFLLLESCAYRGRVRAEGCEETRFELPAAFAGDESHRCVFLREAKDRGRLAVTVRDACGRPVDDATLWLVGPEGDVRYAGRIRAGRREVDDVPLATRALRVEPPTMPDADAPPLMPARVEILPECGHAVAVDVVLPLGGRLHLTARDPENAPVGATFTITDAWGGEVEIGYRYLTGDVHVGVPEWRFVDAGAIGAGENVPDRALAPGWYRVVLHHDVFGHAEHHVEVRAGETTTLDVPLE